ncbi:MAG: peptidoglycan DD-metalloendopeptidase family protein [Nocardioidaceae bacterium]|nr:peptidoglycan DD-metalloendopeptidase family protein [Nocardioidaceae bacterium]
MASDDRRDELNNRRDALGNRIDNGETHLQEISTRLVRAQARVASGVEDLATAREKLADLREQVHQAVLRDRQMQAQLDLAVERLEDARLELVEGREDVEVKGDELAAYAVSSYQTGGADSFVLDATFGSNTPEDALTNLQAADTVLDAQSVAVQELEAAEVLLGLTEQRFQEARQETAERRIAAAENLETKRTLQAQARVAKQDVADRLSDLRAIRQEVAAAKQEEIQRLNRLEQERQRVEERLRRIAERRAERRAERAAELRAEVAPQHAAGPYVDDGGAVLSAPVASGYVTSSYGMRLHPILGIYKLHDGLDLGAGCGTPVYASASGRVISAYYNAGYGNRIIIDHGFVSGVSLSTSYNHMTSFAAGQGEQVDKGELIGYVGSTGYSTGCHMHFMVYVNGGTVDPAQWL